MKSSACPRDTAGEKSGASALYSELNRKGTNTLVGKGTARTGMKDIHVKATVTTSASFGVGRSIR